MWETPQTYGRRYSGQMRLKLSFLVIKENAMSGVNSTPLIIPRTPSAGTGKLVRFEGMMDGAKYREILEGNLFQSSRDLRLGWRFTFQ
ncbi:hypothetical protein J4Q44_G00068390 [Coregonus suidteri]|uniref:Uncharacterized protein n=1 Tax=Coregonus suidteri TaxID=861788 RepID=A0AAN8M9J7_9TELE